MVDSFERTASQKRTKQLLCNPSGIQQSVKSTRMPARPRPRIKRRRPGRGMGTGGLACAIHVTATSTVVADVISARRLIRSHTKYPPSNATREEITATL
jgi:hypothetical protein